MESTALSLRFMPLPKVTVHFPNLGCVAYSLDVSVEKDEVLFIRGGVSEYHISSFWYDQTAFPVDCGLF